MSNPFEGVKDSSIWYKPSSLKVINTYDTRLYIGVVREAHNDVDTNELRYLVEIHYKNDVMLSNCRMLRRWGGVFNYEDYVSQGYNWNDASNNQNGSAAVPGDVVLVSQFAGQGREGVIIGGLSHVALKGFLDATKGPQYKSEFNGIETSINEDGEWTLTFKGQPTNLSKLGDSPSAPVPAPDYDKDVGTSFMKWDKTGSFIISDEATDGDKFQKLFIDKKNGTIDVFSGKVNLHIAKSDQSVKWTSKIYEIDSTDSITYKTKNFEGEATDHVHIKTPKYVIEGEKVRLGEEGASDWLILGSKFRDKQKTLHDTLKTKLQKAKTDLLQAKIKLTIAGSAMSVPISGAIAAGPNISQAATSISDAGDDLDACATAIGDFESAGSSDDYLSAVSKTK
jgi:hypothetical protein